MSTSILPTRSRQRGVALISALLLLLVITMLGVAMFRSYGLQQHIAGNTRDKSLAFQAAMDAQRYGEWWLSSNNGLNATVGSPCTGSTTTTQVCSNLIQADVQDVPWPAYVSYTPATSTGLFQIPSFYISYLGSSPPNSTGISFKTYQIDAAGYGGNAGSVAVVESTYSVLNTKTSEPAPGGSTQVTKNINLGNP